MKNFFLGVVAALAILALIGLIGYAGFHVLVCSMVDVHCD